jgi:ABC-type multidrug transport system fused ATPase/permease subunit
MVYLTRYRKECVVAPAFKMLEALFDLLVPLVMANIINVGIPHSDTGYILRRCALLVLLGVVGLSCSIIAQYFAANAAVGFSGGVRHALFDHIQRLSCAQLEEVGTATLITRMTSDVNQVQNGVNMTLRLFLRSPFIVFGSLVAAFTINLKAALIFAAAIPVLFLIVFGIMALTIPGYRGIQARLDAVMGITRENLTGVRVVRAFHKEEEEQARFDAANAQLNSAQQRVGSISSLMNPMTYVVVNLAVVAILYVGGISIQSGAMLQGDLIALVNYMTQVLVELVKLANLVVLITRSLASADRIAAVLDLTPEANPGTAPFATDASGDVAAVEFCDVGIAYAGSDKESLSHVTFSALPGQTIGVIGGTGSGKSTLVNLIPKIYDCTHGEVRLFGRNIRDYDAVDLRQAVGVVPQRARLFSGTIRSNLCFGAPNATDEQLWQALEAAQCADVVRSKPGGLDEPVEQGGRNFSGGQRQRLTIARALVTQPPILILDDSASALDYATDAALRRSLATLPQHPTIFLVSQRVSSLQHADLILVLEDGAVVGMGNHAQLLESCPVYREIYESQFQAGGASA